MIYFWFIIGAVVGSFLNVCIYRLPREESIAYPGSHCPECGAGLAVLDLIPVISYLWLRGRCRYCGARISGRYPLVELLSAAAFAAAWLAAAGDILSFIFQAVFLSVMIVVFFVDLEHLVIPDAVSLIGIVSGLLFNLLKGTFTPGIIDFNPLFSSVAGMVLGFGLLYAVSFFGRLFYKKEVVGEGDLYLGALLGAYLGWGSVLLAIFLAYLLAALVLLALLALRRVKMGGYIPFGPALAVGGVITLFFGGPLINWYLGNFWL